MPWETNSSPTRMEGVNAPGQASRPHVWGGGGAMQVIRDAILEPPYKRRNMYVLVITSCKAGSRPMQCFVARRNL